MSAVLLKTEIPVISNDNCKNIYAKYSEITSKQLCAGGFSGRDSCAGDSGGPLKQVTILDGFPKFVQYGIVSYGPRYCGTKGLPGVYTKVTPYMTWILDHLKPEEEEN